MLTRKKRTFSYVRNNKSNVIRLSVFGPTSIGFWTLRRSVTSWCTYTYMYMHRSQPFDLWNVANGHVNISVFPLVSSNVIILRGFWGRNVCSEYQIPNIMCSCAFSTLSTSGRNMDFNTARTKEFVLKNGGFFFISREELHSFFFKFHSN